MTGEGPVQPPTVSVIVPVRDDPERLGTCLDALEGQGATVPFEILVVDNGSAVDPAPVLDGHPRCRLLRESEPSSYAARNTGIRAARGSVLAFTDADCIPAGDWLAAGLEALGRAGPRAFVGGRIAVFAHDDGPLSAAELYELAHGFPQDHYTEHGGYSVTANLIANRSAFDEVGLFEPALVSSGDREWGRRATAGGYRAVYSAEALVSHPARRSLSELRVKARRIQHGRAQLRALRGERLRAVELGRAFLPPVRSVSRQLGRVRSTRRGDRVRYLWAAVFVHYVNAFEMARHVVGRSAGRG